MNIIAQKSRWPHFALLCFATLMVTLALQIYFPGIVRSKGQPKLHVGFLLKDANPWEKVPDFQLYIRLTSNARYEKEYKDVFLRTMRLFFPKESIKLVVVLDDENIQDHRLGAKLQMEWPFPAICYSKPGDRSTYYGMGRTRMFWNMLNPDECTNATYVGFVDTDTFFSTFVTPELLFENRKPVIVAKSGAPTYPCWEDTSEIIIGKKSVMQCMSTFPLMIKTSHMKEMREVLSKEQGKPFNEIFRDADKHKRPQCICQFSIMCNYVWYYHRDEYSWHVQMIPDGNWTGESRVESQATLEYMQNEILLNMRLPIPRASIHLRYTITNGVQLDHREPDRGIIEGFVKEGLCYSAGFEYCPEKCKQWNDNNIHYNLYSFEYAQWFWDSRCKREQEKHYKNVKRLVNYHINNRLELFGVASIRDLCNIL